MPTTKKFNRPRIFGDSCCFTITDWSGFIASATQEYATITGTLEEVATPYGTGIRVAQANSYVQFSWTSLVPLGITPKSIFLQSYFPDVSGIYIPVFYGSEINQDGHVCSRVNAQYGGGLYGAGVTGGVATTGWSTQANTVAGIAGASHTYGNGINVVSAWLEASVTTYGDLYLFRFPTIGNQCPVGTIVQTVLVFNRQVGADEILDLHNACVGNKL